MRPHGAWLLDTEDRSRETLAFGSHPRFGQRPPPLHPRLPAWTISNDHIPNTSRDGPTTER
jgi:hypothetical protein